ncbi:MAG: UDP-N-acetylglucosamine 1-carboxyvinyltransferase [Alphaproteobacteria bacterium]|nr:UDP-N-acetylglucosamine 1-carboxyvinyltransferase [Alphaproteobacteria bacterium]
MDSIIIHGGKKLHGVIRISGSKNAGLPIMAASILTPEEVLINNIPRLADISTMKSLIETIGAECQWTDQNTIKIIASNITSYIAPYDLVRKMRASIWLLGPLLARFGYAEVSMPGGCALGARMVDQHIAVMQALGAEISTQHGYITASCNGRLRGANYNFTKISVGATINGILAASLAEGATTLSNCACEPEIVDLCNMLNKMGASISGIGTNTLYIEGKQALHGCEHKLIADRIEAGTYMCALGIAGGKITLENIEPTLVDNTITQLQQVGIKFTFPRAGVIEVSCDEDIISKDIQTHPYPGFSTDLQAQYMALMTYAKGSAIISENIFENRFMHVPELCRMGANIVIDGHTAIVNGVGSLTGVEVMASDLRASSSLIIAGLNAEGLTKVRRVYHLDRGYEQLVEKLQACGVDIERVHGDTP